MCVGGRVSTFPLVLIPQLLKQVRQNGGGRAKSDSEIGGWANDKSRVNFKFQQKLIPMYQFLPVSRTAPTITFGHLGVRAA